MYTCTAINFIQLNTNEDSKFTFIISDCSQTTHPMMQQHKLESEEVH